MFYFYCTLLYVRSSIAIILTGKRELVALLNLSSWCLVMVEWLFLTVPWGCLQFVIVVFPDHTHLLFFLANIVFKINSDQSAGRVHGIDNQDSHYESLKCAFRFLNMGGSRGGQWVWSPWKVKSGYMYP